MVWYSNRGRRSRNGQPLEYGVYGVSNALLDTPWPKLTRAKAQFASLLCQGAPEETFFEMLTDGTRANDCRLPDTGMGWKKSACSRPSSSAPRLRHRCSTVLRVPIVGEPVLTEHVVDPMAMQYSASRPRTRLARLRANHACRKLHQETVCRTRPCAQPETGLHLAHQEISKSNI
jgi:uncharacterized protein with NRDE domain